MVKSRFTIIKENEGQTDEAFCINVIHLFSPSILIPDASAGVLPITTANVLLRYSVRSNVNKILKEIEVYRSEHAYHISCGPIFV
jgi:hypothetical protein